MLPGGSKQTRITQGGDPALRSYFARHWRGDLSLPTSFWVNGVLVAIVFAELVFAVPWISFVGSAPKLCSWTIIVLWVLLGVITVWQFVGIWRACANQAQQGGSTFWRTTARIVIVLALLKSLGEFVSIGAPQIYEYSQIGIGRDPLGTYELSVTKGGSELQINGALVFGLTDDVRGTLDANPSIRILGMNSKGGRTSEARKLRDLVDARGLTTSTEVECLSACSLAYAAGKYRLLGKDARLGFHQYSFPGTSDINLHAQYEKDKKDWLARGFASTMVDRAFATPNSEIWTPSHDELLKWGVVTGHELR